MLVSLVFHSKTSSIKICFQLLQQAITGNKELIERLYGCVTAAIGWNLVWLPPKHRPIRGHADAAMETGVVTIFGPHEILSPLGWTIGTEETKILLEATVQYLGLPVCLRVVRRGVLQGGPTEVK